MVVPHRPRGDRAPRRRRVNRPARGGPRETRRSSTASTAQAVRPAGHRVPVNTSNRNSGSATVAGVAYPATILADLAQDLLTVGENALLAAGLDLPQRRFVSHGQPAGELLTGDDCPSTLAAWISRVGIPPRPPGTGKAGCSTKSVAELNLTLYRCVPTMLEDGSPPDPLDLDASGAATRRGWFGPMVSACSPRGATAPDSPTTPATASPMSR